MTESRKVLLARIDTLQANASELAAELMKAKNELRAMSSDKFTAVEAANKEAILARDQFDDLKRRLFDSETELAKLRGYIARVREDDTVREELIPTGDPEAPQLVPKRKNEIGFVPVQQGETEFNLSNRDRYGYTDYNAERVRKHWVTY